MNSVVILLSGTGTRLGQSLPKQFIELKGSPLFSYSLTAFEKNKLIDEIILVVNPLFIDLVKEYLNKQAHFFLKPIIIIAGGDTRQKSSYLGVSAITSINSKVLIHDAVRPFIKQSIIDECISKLLYFQAISTVLPVSDTLYLIDREDKIVDIPVRENYLRAQTPQGFNLETIITAHHLAIKDDITNAPDDCYLVKKYNLADIGLVEGDTNNIKVTYPIDIDIAETILDKYYEI